MLSKEKYFCIFGGGAIRGIAYVGAHKALKELGVEVSGFAGSSAGSIAAVTAALDYSNDEMKEIFNTFDFTLFKDINLSFKIELAFSKGEIFTNKIREIIYNKLHNEKPVTFKDFPKDIYIVTSNLTTGESVIFSKETTPDFEVAQAVKISACFPGLMNPCELNGECYVDGDLAKAYALSQLSPLLNPKDTRILEYRLEGSKKNPLTKNPIVFINNAFDFLSQCASDIIVDKYGTYDKYDFIVINAEDTLLFDLNLSKEKREKLIETGYNLTIDYFKNRLPKKKQFFLYAYKNLLDKIREAYTEFCLNNNRNAKEILLLYSHINNHEKELMDEDIINDFNEIIPLLCEKNEKLLFFKLKSNNYKLLKEKFTNITEKLEKKVQQMKMY